MGNGSQPVTKSDASHTDRTQQMARIYTVMVCLAMLILLQVLLLSVAVEGYLGNEEKVILPAMIASGLCFIMSRWLIGYLSRKRRSP